MLATGMHTNMLELLCRCRPDGGAGAVAWALRAPVLASMIVLIGWAAWSVPAHANPWAAVDRPSAGTPRVFGKYTAGCIAGAERLAPTEPGLRAMRLERRRNYGHPLLLRYLRALGKHMREAGHGAVLVGDLSMPRGGPTYTNHISHQSGLDADVWFRMHPAGSALSAQQRETLSATSFVDWPQRRLEANWGEAQNEMLRFTAGRPEVQRVFVSAVIKAHLCNVTRKERAWLTKIRPWYGHADHMHVRLHCPPGDTGCTPQARVPQGDGCDELDWWLKPRAPGQDKPTKPRARPELPAACQALLPR